MTEPPDGGAIRPASDEPQPTYHREPVPRAAGFDHAVPDHADPGYGDPGTVEFGEAGYPVPPGYPPYDPTLAQSPAPPPRRRRPLLIVSLVLGVVLLLCGGGGLTAFLLLRDGGGEGAPDPVNAVDNFLRAVYLEQDAGKAATMVCPAARDKTKINKKVDEVRGYARQYPNPRFRWTPPALTSQADQRAVVTTRLTMITGDERFAEQQLSLTVVEKTGWWVCDVG